MKKFELPISTALLSLLLAAPMARASSMEVIIGRYYLSQSNLPYANTAFASAQDHEGKVLKALTSLGMLQRETNTVDFVNRVHYTSPINIWEVRSTGYSKSPTRPVPYRATSGTRGAQLVSILRDIHGPVLAQAETDLANFTDNAQLVPLGRSETGYPDISLDRGDVLIVRSLLACGRALIKLANSQNVDVVVNDYLLLEEEPGPVTIEIILSRFPDLAKLANATDLPIARQEAKIAIDLYKQASGYIRSSRPLGVIRLFNLPGSFGVQPGEIYTASLLDEAKFRAKLDEYAALMDGQAAITGFDDGLIDTFNGKPFLDGSLDLRSKIPAFRKNKVRQGSIADATFGGIYPTNTVARTEARFWQETLDNPQDPYAIFGLFIPPFLSINGPTSLAENNPVTLTLTRGGDPSEEIPVSFNFAGTAQPNLDYSVSTSFTSMPSGVTSQPLQIFSLINDQVSEFDETIVLSGIPATETEATFLPFTLTILDDDGTGVGIFATDSQGREGRMNPDPFGFRFGVYDPIRFEVRRTGSTTSALSVKVNRNLLLSSATPDDYQITGLDVDGQSIRIPAGQSAAEIVVSPRYDLEYPEGTESLVLQINPDPAYALTESISASATILDTSIYEWWSYQMGLLVANHPPSLDADGDGMPNLLEMALGRDPNLPDSANSVQEGRDTEGFLTLTFKRWSGGVTAPDGTYTVYGVTYDPQGTSTLENAASWTNSFIELRSVSDNGDGMEQVVVRDTLSKTAPSRFLRLKTTIQQ